MISWLLSPDFLILVGVTLFGFLTFLFFRSSSTKRLRKDDPDFLLRDISKSLSSNDSVEMISGNKTTFVSIDQNEILNSTPQKQRFLEDNSKKSIKFEIQKILKFLKFPFLKEEKYLPLIQDDRIKENEKEDKFDNIKTTIKEKTHHYEKKSVHENQTLEDLSQIELPFFPENEGHENLLKTDDPDLKENLTYDEILVPKDFQLEERNKMSHPVKTEGDEVLFSFSQELTENSETNELIRREKTKEDKKDDFVNCDEIFDVLEGDIETSKNDFIKIEEENKKKEVDFSDEEKFDNDNYSNPNEEIHDSSFESNINIYKKEANLNTSKTKFSNIDDMHISLETICEDLYLSVEKPSKKLSEYEVSLLQTIEEQITKMTGQGESVLSEVLLRFAITCMYQQEYKKATSILKETLLQTEQLGFVLNALAVASFARDNSESSITYSLEALRECGDDRMLKDTVLSNLGFFYLQKGDPEKALKAYIDILEEVDLSVETSLLPNLHLRVGKILNSIGNKDQARHHLTEAIQLSQGKGKELTRIQSLIALASSQTKSGSIEASLKSLEEALRISQLIGNREQEALIQGHMGLAFTAKDQFSKALLYHKKAVEIYKEFYNLKGEASNLASIANIHYFQDNLDEAQLFSEKALEINRGSNNILGKAQNLTNLGRVFFEKNEWAMSCEKLSEARDIYGKLGDIVKVNEIEGILNIAKSNDKKEEVF